MARRIQRTFYIDGVRVRVNYRESGKGRVKVTDPGGDYAKEHRVLQAVAMAFAGVFTEAGLGVCIGPPRTIADHETTP